MNKDDEITILRSEVNILRAALRPFCHPDLRKRMSGNAIYGDSPVYGRDGATLYLRDFDSAHDAMQSTER